MERRDWKIESISFHVDVDRPMIQPMRRLMSIALYIYEIGFDFIAGHIPKSFVLLLLHAAIDVLVELVVDDDANDDDVVVEEVAVDGHDDDDSLLHMVVSMME